MEIEVKSVNLLDYGAQNSPPESAIPAPIAAPATTLFRMNRRRVSLSTIPRIEGIVVFQAFLTTSEWLFNIFRANRCVSHANLLPYEQTGSEMQSNKADLGYSRQK